MATPRDSIGKSTVEAATKQTELTMDISKAPSLSEAKDSHDELPALGVTCCYERSSSEWSHSAQDEDAESDSEGEADFEIDDDAIKAAVARNQSRGLLQRLSSHLRISSLDSTDIKSAIKRNGFPSTFTKVTHHVITLEKDIANVDLVLYRAFRYVIAIWLTLIAISYSAAPKESIVWLEGTEKIAALVELSVLSTAVFMRHGPIFWEMRGKFGAGAPRMSGILAGGLTVQFVALSTVAWMVLFPVPVMIDPVFGSRVHLLRWCEWTPLAGCMTLLMFCIDAPNLEAPNLEDRWKERFHVALMESVSTLCGLIFPFCPNRIVWCTFMTISFVTYSSILWSYAEKANKFNSITQGKGADGVEMYDRARLSLSLHWLCCVTWSGITVTYFLGSAGHLIFPESLTIFHDKAATMLEECFMDCVAKILYMSIIIEAHNVAFDESKRATRRLKELKNTMSAVWENSSDSIAISVQSTSGSITSMVGPSFFSDALIAQQEDMNDISAIVIEVDSSSTRNRVDGFTNAVSRIKIGDLPRVAMRIIHKEDFAGLELQSPFSNVFESAAHLDIGEPNVMTSRVLAFTDMISRAWHAETDELDFEHDVVSPDGKEESRTHFEIKVSKSSDSSIVAVIRDVSERYRRFEAEKRFVYETTARQKDAQANRFTKHEVKNGLLAAIEICGMVRQRISEDFSKIQRARNNMAEGENVISKQSLASRVESITELDSTLHEILDIILAETMSNDVIHELYKPKLGRVDVNHILKQTKGFAGSSDQFSLITSPSPLPILSTDQGLFKCIYSNAIRNALKYGQHGGQITTVATYSVETGMFEMHVINLPGPGHQTLVDLGSRASELVFSHGTRLHSFQDKISAGDGAWIISKCATILGGTVEINFESDRTAFVFKARMKQYDVSREDNEFIIQSGVWAIGIDDSKIQRKLLRRFFIHAGVQEDHQIILGQSAAEISNFVEFVVDFVKSYPYERFFIVADENLEIGGDFMSGSKCIQKIRSSLQPEEESRILALVRSANDSLNDVELYTARAHGYMPKVPLNATSVKEMVSPLWMKRFPKKMPQLEAVQGTHPKLDKALRRPTIENLRDLTLISPAELLNEMEQIDALCVLGRNSDDCWHELWDKLHQLKGDLLSANVDGRFTESISLIEAMRGENAPSDVISRWLKIRTRIASLVS